MCDSLHRFRISCHMCSHCARDSVKLLNYLAKTGKKLPLKNF